MVDLKYVARKPDFFSDSLNATMAHAFLAVTLAITLGITGCASQIVPLREHANYWIGRQIEEYEAIGKRSTSYARRAGLEVNWVQLQNGNNEYISPVRPDCYLAFEVNQKGTIVGYRTEGDRCY